MWMSGARNKGTQKIEGIILMAVVFTFVFSSFPSVTAAHGSVSEGASSTISAMETDVSYTLKVLGNANMDDTIDMRDVTYIKLVIFGKKPETEFCDANNDGRVSMLDVVQTKLIIIEKAGKLTVIDALNRTETLEMPIERVVITFNVEEYLAVGREEALRKVVGWSKYYWEGRRPTVWETYLERFPWIDDIPDVGYPWKGTFSAEKVMDCEPDVVIMCPSQYEQATEDVERLEKAGIPVIIVDFYEPFNIKAHAESTLLLGELLGERERARELISFYVSQVSEILDRLEEVEKTYPKPKVLLLGKEWTTYGKYHYRGEMIERAGGINIAADVLEQSGEIDPEYVLKANPDVIIFIGKLGWNVDLGYGVEKERAEEMLAEQIQRPGWEELNATKNNRVHAIHIYFVHGHIYDYVALQYFVKWFYPDAFTDINPEEAWKEFHERFLPVEYSGTWAVSL